MTTAPAARPRPTVRAEIDAQSTVLRELTAGEYSRAADERRRDVEAHVSALYAELLPVGVDPRFVTPASLPDRSADELRDLLAAVRWAADTADRSTFGGVCDGDAALDSAEVVVAELGARGIPVPAWR